MKLTRYVLMVSLLLLPLFSEVTQTMVTKSQYGQKIFRKELRKVCKFTSARFAQTHTMREWEKLKITNQFRIEIHKLCPKSIYVFKEEWIDSLFAFAMVYAKDSGEYPE